jgi:hypothetical protein
VCAVIKEDVYENVLQRAGWAFLRPILYLQLFFTIKKEVHNSGRGENE